MGTAACSAHCRPSFLCSTPSIVGLIHYIVPSRPVATDAPPPQGGSELGRLHRVMVLLHTPFNTRCRDVSNCGKTIHPALLPGWIPATPGRFCIMHSGDVVLSFLLLHQKAVAWHCLHYCTTTGCSQLARGGDASNGVLGHCKCCRSSSVPLCPCPSSYGHRPWYPRKQGQAMQTFKTDHPAEKELTNA